MIDSRADDLSGSVTRRAHWHPASRSPGRVAASDDLDQQLARPPFDSHLVHTLERDLATGPSLPVGPREQLSEARRRAPSAQEGETMTVAQLRAPDDESPFAMAAGAGSSFERHRTPSG